jgi:hypothetical protein
MDLKIIVLIGVILLMMVFGCKKKTKTNAEHPVPNVPIDITVYPNDPLNFKIQAIGGWIYLNGGINGIILYRKSQQEFVALERTSSYLPDNAGAKAKVMADNFTCRDTISDSRWQIFDGGVTQGPALWGLRVYGATYDGNSVRIKN